jgi:hypothetical protein
VDAPSLRQYRRTLGEQTLRPRQRERLAVHPVAGRDHPSGAVEHGRLCGGRPRLSIADDHVGIELEER